MRLPIHFTEGHQGSALELDHEQATLTLLDQSDEPLGTVSLQSIAEFIRVSADEYAHSSTRASPRAQVAVKVQYSTKEGSRVRSVTSGIGPGGVFIETGTALPKGTKVILEFSLPNCPSEVISATACVAWTRARTKGRTLPPGMGLQFTEIAPEHQAKVDELIRALNRTRKR